MRLEPVFSTRGDLTEAALAGRLFAAANQASVACSTTLNTTFTGFSLCNPADSGKIVIVHEFGYGAKAAVTGESVLSLATTDDTGFAADVTPRCVRNGLNPSVCYCDEAATITAPVIEKIVAQLGQGADSVQFGGIPPTIIPIRGIILDEGRAVVTDSTVATGDVMYFSFLWEEIDV